MRYLVLILSFALIAQAQELDLLIEHPELDELVYKGFSLNEERVVRISAYGAGSSHFPERFRSWMVDPSGMFAYAWILNADTRELVWKLTTENTREDRRNRFGRIYKGSLRLPAGNYEVYFYATEPHFPWLFDGFFSLGKLLEYLLRGEEDWEEAIDRLYIKISGVDKVFSQETVRQRIRSQQVAAVVSLTGLGDSEYRHESFQLTKPGQFQVYGVGEAFEQEAFDYGWILQMTEGEQKIWEMHPETGKWAGGARKNRFWRDVLQLNPGLYEVYFVTDDSHSPEEWNAHPPYDPFYWGITVTGIPGKFDPASVEKKARETLPPLVDLTHLGNNEYVEETIEVTQPVRVRIMAIGEGQDGEMYDYGWIERQDSGKKIWEMLYEKTFHAGGARKNRAVDEIITLAPGTYTVHFVTDDSHSYRHWNASPPFNPAGWGIKIIPLQKSDTMRIARTAAPETPIAEENILVQMVKVGNNEHRRRILLLKQDTPLRIYAIGEGDWDEMYDYAWIEDMHTGEVVWEMTYEDTRWAGGARKNRKVNMEITLPAGKYMVHYITDDSHAYRHWNADPPRDPQHYGITIYRIRK